MFSDGRPLHILESLRHDYPIGLHGVSLSIGSQRQNRGLYLDKLKKLIDRIDPWIVTDHFCWTGLGGHNAFDLLPLPFTRETVQTVVEHIDIVETKLCRRLYLENVSAYAGFAADQMTEIEFINEVSQRSGCGLLLDVNNVYVNACNFGFDAKEYIDSIDPETVGEIHLAGHAEVEDFLFDTHDSQVCDEVWSLYAYTCRKLGKVPTLIEWDEKIPDLATLICERDKAERIIAKDVHAPRRSTKEPPALHC